MLTTLTSFFLDLDLLTLRFFLLIPVLATLPFLPTEEDVIFLLTFLRFPVQSKRNAVFNKHITILLETFHSCCVIVRVLTYWSCACGLDGQGL